MINALQSAGFARGRVDHSDPHHRHQDARRAGRIHADPQGSSRARGVLAAVGGIAKVPFPQEGRRMKPRFSRTQIPLVVLVVFYAGASFRYTGFFSWAVFANLLRDNSFLGLAAIGMTFVILAGGIDLSVGAMVGFTSIWIARLTDLHVHPLLAIATALAVGTGFGAGMGALIRFAALP